MNLKFSYKPLLKKFKKKIPQQIKINYLKKMFLLKKIIINMHFWITDSEIENWFNDKNIFFILAVGRSGTKFLTDLLNKAPRALVVHEPFNETLPYQEAFRNPKSAYEYIKNFRKKEIYLRVHTIDIDTYGEVNSYLRRNCKALKKYLPKAKLLHLIRDGRDVVRSMYSRQTLKPNFYGTLMIYPGKDDPWREKWCQMTRFEKLCWYWMIENMYLRECIGKTVQFEKIVKDYKYFRDNVLKPLELRVSKEVWERERNKPKNVTRFYILPHWSKWNKKMKEIFERICGEEMRKNGYELNWNDA